MQKYSVHDFQDEFPDDRACLDWLLSYRYPDGIACMTCGTVTQHYFVESRKSYSCKVCGHHVYPTADTIFHKSHIPLTSWFYAIYLMAQTQGAISASQLGRELGVSYKAAWRMFNLIRSQLDEGGA